MSDAASATGAATGTVDGAAGEIDAATFGGLLDMTGGDFAFVDELVDTYLDEGRGLIDRLGAAAAAGSADELMRAAHSMKSSSLNVGALRLGELCRGLEADARAGEVPDPAGRVDEIGAVFERARQALLAEREQRQAQAQG